jgi:hypothetical protein
MKMKKMILSGWLILLFAQIVCAQEKIEAPIWNVGDKWVFTQGMAIEVVNNTDENSYKAKFQNETLLFDKSTLNMVYPFQGQKRQTYRAPQRRLFDFPFMIGKSWKDKYSAQLKWEDEYTSRSGGYSIVDETQIFESYRVLGWEDVEVQAGKFKAIKIEYKRDWSSPNGGMREGKAWYWYSPEVRNLVKFQYDKSQIWSRNNNWELVSFHVTN